MTRPATLTKAELKRRVQALRELGLGIAAIKADGTILTTDAPLEAKGEADKPAGRADARKRMLAEIEAWEP